MGEDPLFAGPGAMATAMRLTDWTGTPLGPSAGWPQSLRTAVRIMLSSRYAMWMAWGPELTFFCNDAYRPTLGVKASWALGQSARQVWAEIWPDIGPRIDRVLRTGKATWDEGLLLFLERSGYPEETYHTFSYSPLADDAGAVAGMLCVVTEETERLIGERRLALLRDLASGLAASNAEAEVFAAVERSLSGEGRDLPFALFYLFEAEGNHARLASSWGFTAAHPAAVPLVDLSGDVANLPWPLAEVLRSPAMAATVGGLRDRFRDLPTGRWDRAPMEALVVPIAQRGDAQPAGAAIIGLNPYRQLSEVYRSFVSLFVGQIAAALANARAYEAERRRAEALAELDRAKTAFFSNVSHEFRTPLTLMLGPLEELLADHDLPSRGREQAMLARRNGLRLLKLVNTLLDFSRIEAGRVQACYEPTDLATYTGELASVFRSAIERAGLTFSVDCPALGEPAWVDRDLWEKIVLNLLSNAFKFTLEGVITVSLRRDGHHACLTVSDTGSGIPPQELPRVFERFHRVEGTRGRTHEGTGIGLALVQELVKLHGGSVTVESRVGAGSTFTVTIPLGKAHLPPERTGGYRRLALRAPDANPYVEEALRWLPGHRLDEEPAALGLHAEAATPDLEGPSAEADGPRERVLLADDNADMREYVRRLLVRRYEVQAVADGEEALRAARANPPAVILSDVMMPNRDGFGLVRALRADPRLAGVAVVLLSARAGEEALIEGMQAGADDYLIKPFAARELLARIDAQVQRARFGRALAAAEQRLQVALSAARMAAWEWDTASDRVVLSENAAELFGLLPGQTWRTGIERFELVHPADRERHRALVRTAVARCESYCSEFRIVRPCDQQVAWVEEHATAARDLATNTVRLTGLVMDITERKRVEAALRESEGRFRQLADAAPVLIWMTDASKAYAWFNRSWLAFTGEQLETEVGKGWGSRIHPDDLERCGAAYRASFDAQQPFEMDYRLRRHDGAYRWVLDRGTPLQVEGNPLLLGFMGLGIDITERKETEARREGLLMAERAARESAERISRLKDEFLATLSHELRTPLNAILGWSQVLAREKTESRPIDVGRGLAVIERNSRALARMIEDLLDLNRITAGKVQLNLQPVAWDEVVTQAVESVLPTAHAKGVRLLTTVEPATGTVAGDPGRLLQVVWNLLTNAIKFTPSGGLVQVSLERVGAHLELRVTDTGEGIDPGFLPFVFERFRQADASTTRRHGGLGIGLSMVKQLVGLHDGWVRAESPGLGRGATFTVGLPLAAPAVLAYETPEGHLPAALETPDAGIAKTTVLAGIKILVVDDDPDALELVGRILRDHSAVVVTAGSADEAIAAFGRERPELLLSDIGLPGQDGYELIRRVRVLPTEAGGGTPAAALTAFAGPEDRRRVLLAGYQAHVPKPIEPRELLSVCVSLAATN